MGKIEKILKKGPVEGQTTEVYPVTSTKAVYDENNKRLDNIITGLQESVYLNNPIPISTDNTTESKAQNVKNIADYVEKAKAAGIVSVDGMAVTCLIDDGYSGVGYILGNIEVAIQGILLFDDLVDNKVFSIQSGEYFARTIVVGSSEEVNSDMLAEGARNPIILTPDTTEVDEETYQKLSSDDVDVIFKSAEGKICILMDNLVYSGARHLYFTNIIPTDDTISTQIYGVDLRIESTAPHRVLVDIKYDDILLEFLDQAGYLNKSALNPVLQEIDLIGTDAERKAKLDKFEADWKALTGASDLVGARFACHMTTTTGDGYAILVYDNVDGAYIGVVTDDTSTSYIVKVLESNGSIYVYPIGGNTETDTSMSDTSTNPVQNKVIKAYIDGLVGNVAAQLAQI